mmetsp:Transcript_71084/g.211925  ORF Transcript_71084/g.211925 Transcript_71084/m.211925 type:complete len:278 (-) Transcript_71084:205-1038(-)
MSDHDGHVVAAVLSQAVADDLRRNVAEVDMGVGPKLVAHECGDLGAGHDIPDAVAAQDDDGARSQARNLVDVRDARNLLVWWLLVGVRLVLKIAETSAHSEVAVQTRGVLLGDLAASSFDTGPLCRVVWLVIHALCYQRPLAIWGGIAPGNCIWIRTEGLQVSWYPDSGRSRLVLLFRRAPHHKAARVATVEKLHVVGAVTLLGHQGAHYRRSRILLWILPKVPIQPGIHRRESFLQARVGRDLAGLTYELKLLCQLWSTVEGCIVATMPIEDPECA